MYIQNLQPGLVDNLSYVTVMANKTGRLILKVLDIEGRIAKTVVANINEGKQQLYVNVGYGFVGLRGRVGILPEITIFTLKAGQDPSGYQS